MKKLPNPYIGAAYDSLVTLTIRAGKNQQKFMSDEVLQDATLMRLIDAGENLARIRDMYQEFYDIHSTNAWNNLIGLRNIIAHGYLQVDIEKVWDIIQNELPTLITELEKLM